MTTESAGEIIDLVATLVVALIVWSHYKDKVFPASERYSTFVPRLWTGTIDWCVLWPIGFVANALLALNIPRSLAALLVVIDGMAWLLYTVLMHARYGQTVGKMATGVRVVDFRTEEKISPRQAWVREGIPMVLNLGFVCFQAFTILTENLDPSAVLSGKALAERGLFWFTTMLPLMWFMAEIMTMLANDKRRALHDYIAGTVVIRINIEADNSQQDCAPRASQETPS